MVCKGWARTDSTSNVLVHLPRQVVSWTGSEQRVGGPNHKGMLAAARTKQRKTTATASHRKVDS